MSGQHLEDTTGKYTDEDIASHLAEVNGPVYAWGKSVYELTKPYLETTFQETQGKFTMMDLCSAVPLLKAIVDEKVRLDHWADSKKVVGKIVQAVGLGSKHESNLLSSLPEESQIPLKQRFLLPSTVLRDTLRSGIYSTLTSGAETSESFASILEHTLYRSTSLFARTYEPQGMQRKGGWEIIVPIVNSQSTFVSELEDDFDVELVEKIVTLSSKLCGTPRPVDVFTLDYSDPEDLRQEAKSSFPKYFQETHSFRRMMELHNHIQGDVFDLNKDPESVNLYTSYEGWPYYMAGHDIDSHRGLAANIGSSLKHGGRGLFFPWMTKDGSGESEVLSAVEDVWKSQGLVVTHEPIDPKILMQTMPQREIQLTRHSPIFQESREHIPLMVVHKPF